MTHTPGPWTIGTNDGHVTFNITGPRGSLPYIAHIPAQRPERDANAVLISACPEMLAALKSVVRQIEPILEKQGFAHCGAIQSARAAIAKAEGRT